MLRQGGNEQSELPRRDISCCRNLTDQKPALAAVRSDQRATGRHIGAGAGGRAAFLPRQYPAYTQHALCARQPRNAFTTKAEADGLMTVCNSCRHALWQVRPRLLPLPRSRQIRKREADGVAASGGSLDALLI